MYSGDVKEKDDQSSNLLGRQMSGTSKFDAFTEMFVRHDLHWFCGSCLGIRYEQLAALIYPRPRYRHFTINKRSGGVRSIAEPNKLLKEIQLKVLAFLEERRSPYKPAVHGFVPKHSIVSNARVHCTPKTNQLLNLDLEDFFPSISFYRVRGVLLKRPFNFSHTVATVIAQICTYDGALPQGAPTSPFLSNLVCRSLDADLTNLARRNRAKYTRYADDITFSFAGRSTTGLPSGICSVGNDGRVTLGAELYDLITEKHHFKINAAKTRVSNRARRMEVTGITINKHPNVPRIFVDRVRGALNAWEKWGYVDADRAWQKRVADASNLPYEKKPWRRKTRLGRPPQLKNVLWGKLLYLRMVRGGDDLLYTRLAERYNAAVAFEQSLGKFTAPTLPVVSVVRDHKTAMEAVFVIEWSADFYVLKDKSDMIGRHGTAFAYRQENLLITCNHVFETDAQAGNMSVPVDIFHEDVKNLSVRLLQPHTKQVWPAKVVYQNKQLDFAIVQFDGEVPPHRFFAALEAPIQVRDKGILIGFPAYQNWNWPDMNEQTVLNRTEPNRGMRSFTITGAGSIRPGNSGGPFTDLRFRVAGMAQRGAYMGHGHDESLCYELINEQIERWHAKVASAKAASSGNS